MKKLASCYDLFFTLFKIGLFTFGGGYAMISLLENEFVEKKKWIEHNEFLDIITIAESTPGPIAINSATYIGYKLKGVLGSALATFGVCLPSFIIIYIISLFLDEFMSISIVSSAFKGIQACVVYLILSAGIKMLKKMDKNLFTIVLMSITIIFMITFSLLSIKFSTIYYILIGAAVGLAAYTINRISKKEEEK